jgi:Kef-type K+ transport system membrane component KefB
VIIDSLTPFLQFCFIVIVILLAAKLAGYFSTRLGQPSVFGELLVGLILGPSLINILQLPFLTDSHLEENIHLFGELGVLLLMFLAGLELHLSDLAQNTRVSAFSGILGVIIPVAFGYLAGLAFHMPQEHALFLGLTLGATSVSISAQTLMELGQIRSRVGLGLLGAAVFDDIIVILLLSTVTAIFGGSNAGFGEILWIFVRMLLFFALSVALGIWVLPRLVLLTSRLPVSQALLSLTLVIVLLYAVSAEVFGSMAAITGTFIAGLMFGRTPEKNRIVPGINALAYGLFVPIFFVNIGLQVNLRSLQPGEIWLFVIITIVAILGKIFGAGFGARLGGYNWAESLQLGIGMISRGEVGLIVASVGISSGNLNESNFSAIIGMILVTTLVTPPFLRASFSAVQKKQKPKLVEKQETSS